MKKYLLPVLVFSLILPLIGFAHVTLSTAHMATHMSTSNTQSGKSIVQPIKKRVLSGELKLKRLQNLQNSMSGKTSTGRVLPGTGSFSGAVKKPVVKSTFETAAERQRQREADLEAQKQEQKEAEDSQRANVAAWEAKKKAEDALRKAELEKRQENETIEAYCDRASRQGFLVTKMRVDTIQRCIDKLKAFEAVGKRIAEKKLKEAMRKKQALEDALKRRCLEAIGGSQPVPAACRRISSGSGATQSGGTLATF